MAGVYVFGFSAIDFPRLIVIHRFDNIAEAFVPRRCQCAFCRRLLKWLVTRKNGHIMKNCSVAGIRSFHCRLGLSLNLRGGECMLSGARLLHCDLWRCCSNDLGGFDSFSACDSGISSLHSARSHCERTKELFTQLKSRVIAIQRIGLRTNSPGGLGWSD